MASITKYVDHNSIFDSSTSFIKNTTFDSSIYINVASPESTANTPYAVITLSTGQGQLVRYRQLGNMAWEASTNYASLNYVDVYNSIQDASLSIALAGTTEAWNGLTKTDGSIGLGGTLIQSSTITTDATNTLIFAGLQTSVSNTPLALIQDTTGTAIKTRQLGTMAWATASDYATVINVNNYNSIQDASIAMLDASIIRIDSYNTIQDTSISSLETNLGNYVLKTGDTMSGQLIIGGGGLLVGSIGSPQDVSIYNNLYVHNDVTMGGDLTIDGSLFVRSVESIDVSAGFIYLNTGQVGDPPASMQSGIIIDRGDNLNPYVFIYDESTQAFRIGIATQTTGPSFDDASTQAVATREDNPITNTVPFWNNSESRFDTDASLTYATGILNIGKLTIEDGVVVLNNLSTDGTEFTGLLINNSNEIVRREFGTGAFATIANYALVTDVNAYNSLQDVSISKNTVNIQISDSSIAGHEISILDLSTNKLDGISSTTGVANMPIYSGEVDNIAYIKQLKAGPGAILTGDSSTIIISVSGLATSVNKYSANIDGTIADSSTILQITHNLPAPGPYHVALYENISGSYQHVVPGVTFNVNGDITISWTSGSITDCSVFITG